MKAREAPARHPAMARFAMARFAIAGICLALVAACENTGMTSPEVIAGSSDTVSIATGKFIDPTEAAEDFCAGYNRKAVYDSRAPLNKSGMMDLYIFNCIEPLESAE
jgi:hypothetical protein